MRKYPSLQSVGSNSLEDTHARNYLISNRTRLISFACKMAPFAGQYADSTDCMIMFHRPGTPGPLCEMLVDPFIS